MTCSTIRIKSSLPFGIPTLSNSWASAAAATGQPLVQIEVKEKPALKLSLKYIP
jgi:hypothetical protein